MEKEVRIRLADLILKGKKTPDVIEDGTAYGVEKSGKAWKANVIGLALLGTGLEPEEAAKRFSESLEEMRGNEIGPETMKINGTLGITQVQAMDLAKYYFCSADADHIASMLGNGELRLT